MTIRILDDADEGLRERLEEWLMDQMLVDPKDLDAVYESLLATIPAVDHAAVERAADAASDVIEEPLPQTFGIKWTAHGV